MGVFGEDSDQSLLRPGVNRIGTSQFINYGASTRSNNYFDEESSGGYQEEIEDEGNCIPDDEFSELPNGKFEYILDVPYMLHGTLVGPQGKNIKRIRDSCQVTIDLPPRNSNADKVRVCGSKSNIEKATVQIELLLDGKRFNRKMTHFLTFRLSTSPKIMEEYEKWKDQVQKEFSFDERLFQKAQKLHLTIGVLHLLSTKEVDRVKKLLRGRVRDTINSIMADAEMSEIQLKMEGLEIMNDDPYMTDIVYGKISDPDEILQEICEEIMKIFKDQEFAESKYNRVKIHCTVMNTKFVHKHQMDMGIKNDRTRYAFDASQMIKTYESYEFGKVLIDEVLLHDGKEYDADGYYKSLDSVKF